MEQTPPPHHLPGQGFRNPWPGEFDPRNDKGRFLRWRWDRLRGGVAPAPPPGALSLAQPEVAYPSAPAGEVRITWIGQATFLIQIGGLNVVTDPMWSERASPVRFAGPRRLAPPGLPLDALPQLDAVLVSHDHYDHLDDASVRELVRRFGDRLEWFTPLGFAPWLAKRGARRVRELDWWQRAELAGVAFTALPAQHWCARGPFSGGPRLWCSWALHEAGGRSVYFAGDTGYCPAFREIGERLGPFDAALLPVGAYEPRWFMQPAHMNPEDAVRAYLDLGGTGAFVPMHWGTFRLSDEYALEPPERLRAAWSAAELPQDALSILRPGGTAKLQRRD